MRNAAIVSQNLLDFCTWNPKLKWYACGNLDKIEKPQYFKNMYGSRNLYSKGIASMVFMRHWMSVSFNICVQ